MQIPPHRLQLRIVLALLLLASIASMACLAAPSGETNAVLKRLLTPEGAGKTGFTVMSNHEMGILWTNSLPLEEYLKRQNLMNGSGLALGDFDGDGWCDIYLCNRFGPNALYRNLGNWKFEEVAAKAGVACEEQLSGGAVFADVDGDSRLDLSVTSFKGPNALFLNLGNGRFTNVTSRSRFSPKGGATSQAFSDLDGDGDLDLYVCHIGVEAILRDGAVFSTRMVRGKPVVTGRFSERLQIIDGKVLELGDTDYLYENLGDGKFQELPWETIFRDAEGTPVAPPYDMGLAVQIRDINGDGLPDIYTCNDFQTPDRLWLNQGGGRFRAIEPFSLRNMSYASMGIDFADINRDGHLDFFTVEMLSRDHRRHFRQSSAMASISRSAGKFDSREDVARNALFLNRGDGTYAETAWFSGVAASDWSWTPIFLDVDLDGFEDLLISNGHLRDVNDRDSNAAFLPPENQRTARAMQQAVRRFPELATPNVAYRNLGNLQFQEAGADWGFAVPQITHGMALADLDNDGDQDIVGNCPNSGPLVYRNDSPAPRISVRLRGNPPNTQGIGALVTLRGGPFSQSQEILSGARYVSGDDPTRTFAVPDPASDLSLEIKWRNGRVTTVPGIQANHHYEIAESSSQSPRPVPAPTLPVPLFEDISRTLNHTHHESKFEDFIRQPLLPKKLTQLGPGIAWFDLNRDGYEELIIGAGRGGKISIFENAAGKLRPRPAQEDTLPDDAAAILGWSGTGTPSLLIGMAQYERAQKSAAPLLQKSGEGLEALPGVPVATDSTGPLAMADIEGDGDLDLFIGGRHVPGKYPAPASSFLFLNESGKFVPHQQTSSLLRNIGLVSAATFTDLQRDGFPELVLACEWGPIRVFHNERGEFSEITSALGLGTHLGLWTSITAGDFDGDGRMDLVAGNWGLNSYHQRAPEGPWFLYYGDLNLDGRPVILEAYFNPAMQQIVPLRNMEYLSMGMPWLPARIPTHQEFASSSVDEILGEHLPKMTQLRATTLASTLFWNRGDHFEPEPLPDQCQWSPLLGLNVADFNGDGHEDLFAAQNFFSVRPEDDRLDAGRGILLAGSAAGKLTPVSGQLSGLKIYGGQRGSAAADFDGDGRADLAVTQNGAPTRLFRNQGAPAGLRIRLAGPPGNPQGYGAVLHWRHGGKRGPAREIRSGGGYWSQDGAIQVLHGIPSGAELVILWPGGSETREKIPASAKEIAAHFEGGIKVVR